ncbi:chemotaxis protein CheX [Paenibacillus sp. P46E]|uniref:chemotaxis protein CheX n=1 Tax=Paenibacillus sp. P46E TaxID=1349436 RepID=UPI00093C9F03|nr:chemotaxis protein CheX [Paenibacillus sp. P46E]OKP98769.1 hypothetical protein A3849_08465 [Paenibacillus sp. P46E]
MKHIEANHLNTVLAGIEKVLVTHLGTTFRAGVPSIEQPYVNTENVSVMVGMTGDLRGEIILSMDDEVLKGIVSTMFGFRVDVMDDMGWSAFSEFGNWVGAACCTAFHEQELNTNITPPVIHEGKGSLRTSSKFVSIPVYTGELTIMAHISLGE